MKKILIIITGLMLISFNAFADDVSIDSNGNVQTGVANPGGYGNLDVTGASGEHAVRGVTSGTGAAGVYGENNTSGSYGYLGYFDAASNYGVYGYSTNGYAGYFGSGSVAVYGFSAAGWAGYFDGDARVVGDFTVDGNVIGPNIGDITAVTVNFGTGLSGGGTSGAVTLDADTTYLQRRVTGTCGVGSSIRSITATGAVTCETDDVGITIESDPKVGTISDNYVPKWNGSALANGLIYDSGTNIGIGTTSPSAPLHVMKIGNSQTGRFETNLTQNWTGYYTSNGYIGYTGVWSDNFDMDFGTGSSNSTGSVNVVIRTVPKLTVDQVGNVGIGTTSPTEKLTVAGTIETTNGGIKFPDDTIQTTAAAPSWHQVLPAAERFVLVMNSNAAVLDRETGLVWEKSPSTTSRSWENAISYCANLDLGGRKGWLLPTVEQLASLIDTSTSGSLKLPTGHPFIGVQSGSYWSATIFSNLTDNAWFVNFSTSLVSYSIKTFSVYTWCVRGGQSHDAY